MGNPVREVSSRKDQVKKKVVFNLWVLDNSRELEEKEVSNWACSQNGYFEYIKKREKGERREE